MAILPFHAPRITLDPEPYFGNIPSLLSGRNRFPVRKSYHLKSCAFLVLGSSERCGKEERVQASVVAGCTGPE